MISAVEALEQLDELGRFYGSLAARQHWGEHVCLAAQPANANGSVEDLVERGVDAGAAVTGGWARQIVEAVTDRSSVGSIQTALGGLTFDLEPLARVIQEELLRGALLGALDSEWEREHGQEIEPAKFSVEFTEGAFSNVPFADAVRHIQEKQVLPPAAFAALEQGTRRRAFSVAGMASQEMLNVTKAELARVLNEGRTPGAGVDLRSFQKFAKERLESAGWTPQNKSHVETIYRTNVVGAYASGRFTEMRKPDVLAAMPYWQIRGVKDSRQRPTHRDAHNIVLPANHPFWLHAYPPFGFNCRCRVIARTKRWLDASGLSIGPVPTRLPDPGFDAGTRTLLQVPDDLLKQPVAPPAPPVAAAPPAPGPVAAPPIAAPHLHPQLLEPPPPAPPPHSWLDDTAGAERAAAFLRQNAPRMSDLLGEWQVGPSLGGEVRRLDPEVRQHGQGFIRRLVPGAVSRDGGDATLFSRVGMSRKRGALGSQNPGTKRIDLDDAYRARAQRALRRVGKGEFDKIKPLSKQALSDLEGLHVYLHEEIHGFSRNVRAYRGIVRAYRGIAVQLEEVGTELTAREALFRVGPRLDTPEFRQRIELTGAYRRLINEVLEVVMKHTGESLELARKRVVHAHGKIIGRGAPIESPDEHLAEFVAGLDLAPERAQLVIADLRAL